MSIVIDCNEKILQAFPMLSTPALQFMYTDYIFRALQALNRPVRCKEIRQWIKENASFPRDVTIEMISACCLRLVKMGLVKREMVDGAIREIPREGFCSWAHDVERCKKCKMCHFNEDYSKVLMKESIAYYSLV
jgi:hypothetical protein